MKSNRHILISGYLNFFSLEQPICRTWRFTEKYMLADKLSRRALQSTVREFSLFSRNSSRSEIVIFSLRQKEFD